MNRHKEWVEWIKNIPNWIKGAIGLVTLIITFTALFQNNPYLSITVSVTLILITVFCFSLYLILSKEESPVVGGGRRYRFKSYRPFAFVGIIVAPALVIALLTYESS